MERRPSKAQDKFIIRLPDGMRDRLKAAALKNRRTTTAEIVSRLQDSFELDSCAFPVSEQVDLATFEQRLKKLEGFMNSMTEGANVDSETSASLLLLEKGRSRDVEV